MASSLTHLDLFRNSVYNSGDEGHGWLGRLYNLRVLKHGQTNFEYNGIPPQISRLENLVEYDCSFTLYFGPLQGFVFEGLQNLGTLSEFLRQRVNSPQEQILPLARSVRQKN